MRLGRGALVIGIQLGVVMFIGALGTVVPHQSAPARVAAQLFLLPVLVAALLLARRRRATSLDLPIIVALALSVVVCTLSQDPTGSLQTLGLVGGWALLFVVMGEVGRRPWLRGPIVTAVALTVTTWLVIFAVVWIGEKVTWVALGGGIPNLVESTQSILWLTVNAVPVLALLGAPLVAHLPSGRFPTLVRATFVVAAALAIVMSGGRAAWIGIVAAVVALVMLGGVRPVGLPRRTVIPVAAAVGALAAVTILAAGERLLTLSGLSARWPLWSQAVGIAAADPLTGGGPSTFAWLRLMHAEDYAARVPAILAHDVPLQTLADGGVLLLAGLTLVVGAFGLTAWRLRDRLSIGGRWALAALAGYGVTSLLDDHSSLPALTAMVVTLAAWITSESPPAAGRRAPGWLLPVAATAVVLVALPSVIRVDLARLDAERGRAAALSGDLATASVQFERSAQWYPENALYRLEAGISHALAGAPDQAADHFRAAAALSPGDPRPLGALADLAPSSAERLALLDQASRLTGEDPQYSYRLGIEGQAQGSPDWQTTMARAVAIDRTVLAALERDVGPAATREVLAAVPAVVTELGDRLRLDPQHVADDLALHDGTAPASAAAGVVWASLSEEAAAAERELADARRTRPYDARTWEAAAFVARDACDADAYRRAALLRFWSPGSLRARTTETVLRSSLDLAYRETGLGTYQPGVLDRGPLRIGWPEGVVGETRSCPGWDLAALEDPFR